MFRRCFRVWFRRFLRNHQPGLPNTRRFLPGFPEGPLLPLLGCSCAWWGGSVYAGCFGVSAFEPFFCDVSRARICRIQTLWMLHPSLMYAVSILHGPLQVAENR